MKYYDSNTDKIIGCKVDTISYYHEEGHRKQFKSGFIGKMEMFQRWATYLFFFVLALMSDYGVFMILLLLIVAPEIIIELDAWVYAIKKYVRMKK